MRERMARMLYSAYGLRTLSLRELPAGWSASAWQVRAPEGDYFLKVYDKHKPSAKSWVARIDSYMPAVLWLHGNTELRECMTAPLLTKTGAYRTQDEDFLYMLFPFIHGETIGGGALRPEQLRDLALITARLHSYDAGIPVPTAALRETFDVSFCSALSGYLESRQGTAPLRKTLAPYEDTLKKAIAALQEAAALLRNARLRFALCHTDIHGWNLMQSGRLILIDWEGLKLAPVEADFFSFTESFFFGDAWEEFLSVYRNVHAEYRVDPDAMRFYRLRRRLEDIQAFAESILLDALPRDELARSLVYLKRELKLLRAMR